MGVPVRIAHIQNCERHLSFRARVFDRFVFTFANVAFACSRAVLRFCEKHLWYPTSKCHVVYNGVVTKRFENLPPKELVRRNLGFAGEHVLVTTVASLERHKGHVYLLEAGKEVIQRSRNIHFLFVGDGSLRAELESRAAALGIAEHVHFLGERLDVPEILAGSDIFVLPSLSEGLSLALVEAGLAGLPVVASRVDGIPEIVEDGWNGILVPPRDVAALAGALQALAEDVSHRERMGKEGRAIALERFSMERTAFQVATLYRRLLERERR